MISRRVHVTTGARLHFGLLSHHSVEGRRFGGAGLMIDSPGFQIEATRSDLDEVKVALVAEADVTLDEGFSSREEFGLRWFQVKLRRFYSDGIESMVGKGFSPREQFGLRLRATEFQGAYDKTCPISARLPGTRIVIRRAIPSHAGLGSGTQLGMAIAKSLSILAGQGEVSPTKLAHWVNRGARSALGIHGFEQGGFLIDGGKTEGDDGIGTLAARADFPAEWRFVIVTPPRTKGVSGEVERKAFDRLAPMSPKVTMYLRQLLRHELYPAVVEADFDGCGELLFEFGRRVGEYFSSVQKGTFADARMAELVGTLRGQGIRGVGQTSWGPSLFVLMPNQQAAEFLVTELSQDDRWGECHFRVARAMNCGAVVTRC